MTEEEFRTRSNSERNKRGQEAGKPNGHAVSEGFGHVFAADGIADDQLLRPVAQVEQVRFHPTTVYRPLPRNCLMES